jgi:hypothetical protein
MKLTLRRTLASMTAGGLLVLGSVGSALAAQPATSPIAPEGATDGGAKACSTERSAAKDNGVGNLRKLGDCEINRRLVTITVLQDHVSNPNGLTDSHRSALQALLTADATGLTALKAKIDGETDVPTLRADIATIVTGYRIYLLVVPVTAEVISADSETAAVGRLSTAAGKLQDRIDAAKAAGKDVSAAQADLDNMTTALGEVDTSTLAGISSQLLGLTPADYNDGGPAKGILQADHKTLQGFRASLNAARTDAVACRAALKAL